jgi:hypothetical protein
MARSTIKDGFSQRLEAEFWGMLAAETDRGLRREQVLCSGAHGYWGKHRIV